MSQTSSPGLISDNANMTAAEIKKFDEVQANLVLPDYVLPKGKPVIVTRYHNPKTGQMFDLTSDEKHYRQTRAPQNQWEIIPFEEWRPVRPG